MTDLHYPPSTVAPSSSVTRRVLSEIACVIVATSRSFTRRVLPDIAYVNYEEAVMI